VNPAKKQNPTTKQSGQQQKPADQQQLIAAAQWSGPLPPPAALEHFNDIIPNGADRIMTLVEKEQEHRIQHENTALRAEITDFRIGMFIGAFLTVLCVVGAVLAAYLGAHPMVSIAMVSLPIMILIGKFLARKAK